jgi:hypothetical protein
LDNTRASPIEPPAFYWPSFVPLRMTWSLIINTATLSEAITR